MIGDRLLAFFHSPKMKISPKTLVSSEPSFLNSSETKPTWPGPLLALNFSIADYTSYSSKGSISSTIPQSSISTEILEALRLKNTLPRNVCSIF